MRTFACFALLVSVAACGGGGGSEPDARPRPDAAPGMVRNYVINRVTMSATQDDVDNAKFVYPGSGIPVNKVGALIKVLMDLIEGIPLQTEIDANFDNGEALQVFSVEAFYWDTFDDGASARFGHVVDADDPVDPSNNFGGSGVFALGSSGSLVSVFSTLTIDTGSIEGNGTADETLSLLLPIFAGEDPVEIPGIHPVIRGTIDEDGFSGYAGFGVTVDTVHNSIFPVSARVLTRAIAANVPMVDSIRSNFDLNMDDEVTVSELIANNTLAALSTPDMDLDGDTVNDYISAAVPITAVRATLNE